MLELGSGSGAMAENLLRSFPEVQLVASDLDERMIFQALQRLEPWPNARVERADSTNLPFDDESFDVVVSFLMLHHVIEWKRAIAEADRVLRPGGLLIGYDLTRLRLATWVHRADKSPHLLIAPAELSTELRSRRYDNPQIDESFARHVMRFTAQKPSRR